MARQSGFASLASPLCELLPSSMLSSAPNWGCMEHRQAGGCLVGHLFLSECFPVWVLSEVLGVVREPRAHLVYVKP